MKKLEGEVALPQSSCEPPAKKRRLEEGTNHQEAIAVQSTLDFDPDREINLDVSSSSDSDEDSEDSDFSAHKGPSKNKKEQLDSPHLSLMNCIAICYLGILYAEETVLLVDIARLRAFCLSYALSSTCDTMHYFISTLSCIYLDSFICIGGHAQIGYHTIICAILCCPKTSSCLQWIE